MGGVLTVTCLPAGRDDEAVDSVAAMRVLAAGAAAERAHYTTRDAEIRHLYKVTVRRKPRPLE